MPEQTFSSRGSDAGDPSKVPDGESEEKRSTGHCRPGGGDGLTREFLVDSWVKKCWSWVVNTTLRFPVAPGGRRRPSESFSSE